MDVLDELEKGTIVELEFPDEHVFIAERGDEYRLYTEFLNGLLSKSITESAIKELNSRSSSVTLRQKTDFLTN